MNDYFCFYFVERACAFCAYILCLLDRMALFAFIRNVNRAMLSCKKRRLPPSRRSYTIDLAKCIGKAIVFCRKQDGQKI